MGVPPSFHTFGKQSLSLSFELFYVSGINRTVNFTSTVNKVKKGRQDGEPKEHPRKGRGKWEWKVSLPKQKELFYKAACILSGIRDKRSHWEQTKQENAWVSEYLSCVLLPGGNTYREDKLELVYIYTLEFITRLKNSYIKQQSSRKELLKTKCMKMFLRLLFKEHAPKNY